MHKTDNFSQAFVSLRAFLMHASFALLIDKVKNFVHYIKKDSILKRTA